MSRESDAAERSPNQKRFVYLSNLAIKTPDRAHLVGVKPNDLPKYIQGLVDEGLLDFGERITPLGLGFRYIAGAGEDGMNKRALWRKLGGDEERVDTVLAKLVEVKLVKHHKRADRYEAIL